MLSKNQNIWLKETTSWSEHSIQMVCFKMVDRIIKSKWADMGVEVN